MPSSHGLEDFEILQLVTFPRLETLKVGGVYDNHQVLMEFIEDHGRNLKSIHLHYNGNDSFSLNLVSLNARLEVNEMET